MSPIVPRFEFRTFAQDFGAIGQTLRERGSDPKIDGSEIEESREVYLISRDAGNSNVKVRGGSLEIKRLIGHHANLERWTPTAKQPFPLARDFVQAMLLPALAVTEVLVERESFTFRQLIDDFIHPHPWLIRACVFKRRFRFQLQGCDGEIDELLINGAAIQSIAIESVDADALLDLVNTTGLGDHEQVNYPLAIRRIVGFEPLPDEDQYG